MTTGWYGLFGGDTFLMYNILTVTRRLTVRPLDQSRIDANGPDLRYGAEAQRWFDYWLKGLRNGIMDEPAIHYYLMGAPKKRPGKHRLNGRWER